jgi:hypothetical protein
MIIEGDAPIRAPHAVVPHGQMRNEDAQVVPPGQESADLPEPNINQLRRMFDNARDLTNEARKDQQTDQDYYDGPAQLSSEVRDILKARGQPPIMDNRIAPAIDGILGVMESGKTDPRAFPRNPEDQQSAEVATKTLRYIADRTRYQQIKMDCAEDYLKQGLTAVIVEWDGKDISIQQIRWETFFYDPTSRRNDFSDAKYLGIAKWMYADEIKRHPEYGERARLMGDLTQPVSSAVEDTWQDRPEEQMRWADVKAQRILVVEMYYKHSNEWLRCVFCGAGWLDFGKSPYVNVLTGETRCPIEGQSFKVDRKNNRYGPIRNMRPMQDEVNARRSRGLHLLNSRQVQQTDMNAPPVDADTVRQEAARADGVIPQGWQAVSANDMATGNLNMLAEAKDSLSRMVPVAIAQDLREGSASSGRARQVAQQAGLTQFGRGFGRFDDLEQRVYRQMWQCAQQFWTEPMYIRVTDNPRAPEFLQINEPIMGMVMQPQPVMDQMTGQPTIDPATGQPAVQMVPGVGVTGYDKRIAAMDMDIIIASTPDTVALETETFEAIMGLVQSGVDPMSPVFQIMLELSPLPDKTRVMERIEAVKQEAAQAMQAQQEQQAQQLQLEAGKIQAETALTSAKAEGQDLDNKISLANALAGVEPGSNNRY